MTMIELTSQAPAGTEFAMSRILEAPRELVWKAFTEHEQLKRWWGPAGMAVTRSTFKLEPGGVFHFALESPDGFLMWAKWTFQEIVPPERLVFVNAFSDETGGLTRHPGAPEWPTQMLVRFEFVDHGERTELKLWTVSMEATAEEHQVFKEGHESMRGGFGGTFDRLEAFLKQS